MDNSKLGEEITMTGDELVIKILGQLQSDGTRRREFIDDTFFYRGSAMRQARENILRAQNNPTIRPIPFTMPSAVFDDNYAMTFRRDFAQSLPEDERVRYINPPKYTISTVFYLGQGVNFDSNSITLTDIPFDIVIKDVTFSESVYLTSISSIYNINFVRCSFMKDIYVSYLKCNKLTFTKCSYQTSSFHNCNITLFELGENYATQTLINSSNAGDESYTPYINDFEHEIGSLILSNDNSKNFIIEKCKVKNIDFIVDDSFVGKHTDSTIDIKLKTENVKIQSKEKRVTIDKLSLELTSGEGNSQSQLRNCVVKEIVIEGSIKKDSAFGVYVVDCQNFTVKNFVNEGKFLLMNFRIINQGIVRLFQADLGKFLLLGVDFENSSEFIVAESNITDIVINDTHFPSNIAVLGAFPSTSKREIYRHLKNASSKQGDRYSELKYEALEMEILRGIFKKKNSYDSFIFNMNYYSSRHGQDWVRAGAWLLILSAAVFCLIQLTLGYTDINIYALPDNAANFILFINPVHRISEVFVLSKSEPFDGIAKFLDGSFRIVSGYLIFQFLRAFRKYFR